MTTYHTETRAIDGKDYRVEWEYDEHNGAPEVESDGYGVVADMDYDPAEYLDDYDYEVNGEPDMEEVIRHQMMRPLQRYVRYMHARKYYDVWETMKRAKKDGWRDLKFELENPDATEEQKLMGAVDADYDYLRGWYEDDWHWCCITVIALDKEGDDTGHEESLCGICSDDKEHHEEVIRDLTQQIEYHVKIEATKDQMELPI
jgi:hypothetical protein